MDNQKVFELIQFRIEREKEIMQKIVELLFSNQSKPKTLELTDLFALSNALNDIKALVQDRCRK